MNIVAKGKQIWEDVYNYLNHGIWYIPTEHFSKVKKFFIKLLKIAIIAVKEFRYDRCIPRASALTYYSLLAVVPALAFVFGIAKGFGMDDYVEKQLIVLLEGQEEMLERVLIFVRSLLMRTKGGLIAGIGFIVLMWSVVKLLGNVEKAMNDIWKISKQRTILRRFTDYLSIMLFAPIFIMVSGSVTGFFASNVDTFISNIHLQSFALTLLDFVPWVTAWIMFILIFLVMPNGRINTRNAVIAGILTGTAYQLVFYYYYTFQVYISSLNVIYGSFAAIPLFFIWMRINWLIILFGAELTAAIGRTETYILDKEELKLSDKSKKIFALMIMYVLIQRFEQRGKAYTVSDISKITNLPHPFIVKILNALTATHLTAKIVDRDVNSVSYQPAYDTNLIRVSDVLEALDKYNFEEKFNLVENDAFFYFSEEMGKVDELIRNSSLNVYLKELKFNFSK